MKICFDWFVQIAIVLLLAMILVNLKQLKEIEVLRSYSELKMEETIGKNVKSCNSQDSKIKTVRRFMKAIF